MIVYLAYGAGAHETLTRHVGDEPVDLLVAYPTLKEFLKRRSQYNVRQWVLDSGAFSVFNSGKTIAVEDYIAVAKDVDAKEVFGLDVIGNSDGTKRNLETMWAAGVPAIPTYHIGEDESALTWCAANSDKIALGGIARTGVNRIEWLSQVFARVWPKRIHGFGCASEKVIMALPFESVDASSWVYAPAAMGHYAGYTGRQMHLRSKPAIKDYWIEVLEHQRRANLAAFRWRRELALLKG